MRIERQIGLRLCQRRTGGINRQHARRTASQSLQGKTTGVAETVQDILAGGQLAKQGAVVALVEIETGFVPADDVDRQRDAVFVNRQRRIRGFTIDPAGGRFQTFQTTHIGIGTLVNTCTAGRFDQAGHNRIAPLVGTGRGQLDHNRVGVLVGNDTGQTIRLGMNQTQALLAAQFGQRLTARHGSRDATFEKGIIDGFFRIESPETGADLRFRAIRGLAQRTQVIGQHLHRIARTGAAFKSSDRTGKQPRVMLLERGALLTRHENQLSHIFLDLK